MLDSLRNQASFEPGDEEPVSLEPEEPKKKTKPKSIKPAPRPRKTLDQITGMKAWQRFMLAFMLLMMVCVGGMALLVLTGKMVLPLGF